jgi:threonine dehydrogenase-like Zn-dependent dehydrogenase
MQSANWDALAAATTRVPKKTAVVVGAGALGL